MLNIFRALRSGLQSKIELQFVQAMQGVCLIIASELYGSSIQSSICEFIRQPIEFIRVFDYCSDDYSGKLKLIPSCSIALNLIIRIKDNPYIRMYIKKTADN